MFNRIMLWFFDSDKGNEFFKVFVTIVIMGLLFSMYQ